MGITSGLGKVGAAVTKELTEKAFKSIPDVMAKFGKIGREVEISPQTMHGVQRHLEIQPPKNLAKEIKDVDQLFEGMVSKDPDIREASYAGMAGFDSNARPINEAADGANRSIKAHSPHAPFQAEPMYSTDMNRSGTGGKVSTEEKSSMFASPDEITQFNRRYEDISFESPFAPHHLTPLKTGAQINNRQDAVQVWQAINKISPRQYSPGNTPKNLIASMHRKNAAFIQSGKDSIIKQKPEWKNLKQKYTWNDPYMGEMTSTPDRILKDLSKDAGNAPYGEVKNWSSIGLPESGVWPNGNKVTSKQKAAAWKERYEYHGIDRKKVKFDPEGDIQGSDHVEIGHRATDIHPAVQKMEELLNDQKRYLSLPPEEAAKIIEPGLRISNNIFININKLRLDLIKEKLGFLIRTGTDKNGRPKFKKGRTKIAVDKRFETEHIINWIKNNQRESAALGWKELSGDLKKMLKWLEVDPGKTSDEFNTVFSAELEP